MLAFTTDELLDIFREDVVSPLEGVDAAHPDSESLWKNKEIYRYMTTAADAVARAVEGIYKLVEIPLVVAQQAYTLPRNILHVREGRLITAKRTVHPANANKAVHARTDDYGEVVNTSFWTATGVPQWFVRDYKKGSILLTPIPSAVDTLELQCTSTLGTPLTAGMPLPYMEVPDQELMLLYMYHLAYRKQDADTLDLKRSVEYKEQFDEKAVDRKELLESYRRTPSFVQEDW
jgi:hypothetical protein